MIAGCVYSKSGIKYPDSCALYHQPAELGDRSNQSFPMAHCQSESPVLDRYKSIVVDMN